MSSKTIGFGGLEKSDFFTSLEKIVACFLFTCGRSPEFIFLTPHVNFFNFEFSEEREGYLTPSPPYNAILNYIFTERSKKLSIYI